VIERAEKQWIGWVGVPMLAKVVTVTTLMSLMIVVSGCNANKPAAVKTAESVQEISVSTKPVIEETVDVTRELPGTTSSEFHSVLAASVSGRVMSVSVTDGSSVQRGQSLVQLDVRHLIAGKQSAIGTLRRSRAEVTKAKSALDLEKASSLARVQDAEASLSGAKASLAIATERRSITAEGARTQEVAQARSAVVQADAAVRLATLENDRMRGLVQAGAVPQRDLDRASVALEQATAQRNIARQQLALLEEGARQQERSASSQAVVAAGAAVRQAEAGVAAAKAALKQVLVREADLAAAGAAVVSARANVIDADVSLGDAVIKAPFAGRVVKRLVDPGTMASPGMPLIEVDGGRPSFDTEVPEALIHHFTIGRKATVTIGSVQSRELVGTVSQITPQATGATHAYKVRMALPDTSNAMSGLYGITRIALAKRKAIMVDEASIQCRDGLSYIFIITPGGLIQSRVVTLGTPIKERIPVESGLAIGDVIVRELVPGLMDGVRAIGGKQ
jgi:RND family efflux transporter MFP subunit